MSKRPHRGKGSRWWPDAFENAMIMSTVLCTCNTPRPHTYRPNNSNSQPKNDINRREKNLHWLLFVLLYNVKKCQWTLKEVAGSETDARFQRRGITSVGVRTTGKVITERGRWLTIECFSNGWSILQNQIFINVFDGNFKFLKSKDKKHTCCRTHTMLTQHQEPTHAIEDSIRNLQALAYTFLKCPPPANHWHRYACRTAQLIFCKPNHTK